MFEKFFGKLSAVVHHKAAPYAAERERFLEHCIQQGYTRDWIKAVAARLLVAAYELHTHGGLRASPEDIEAAADRVQQLRSDLDLVTRENTERALYASPHNGWPSLAVCVCVSTAPQSFCGVFIERLAWSQRTRSPRRRFEAS